MRASATEVERDLRLSVRIMQLSPDVLHALAAGDLEEANRTSDVPLTPYFMSPESINTWRRRSKQIVADPDSIEWITGVIWDIDRKLAVGRAGFHAPPDADGMVEVGYAVDPAYRRQGYARAALEELLARAAVETGVRTVRVSVRPDNVASSSLIRQYGFVQVGEQWDDEDGLELIYEIPTASVA